MTEDWFQPVSVKRRFFFGVVGAVVCFLAGLVSTADVPESFLYGAIPGFLLGLAWPELRDAPGVP